MFLKLGPSPSEALRLHPGEVAVPTVRKCSGADSTADWPDWPDRDHRRTRNPGASTETDETRPGRGGISQNKLIRMKTGRNCN